MDEYTSFRKFRLYKGTVLNVLEQIGYELEYPTQVNNNVSAMNHYLLTLRFYATGGHLNSLADFAGVGTATVCRIIVRVSEAIARLYFRHIKITDDIVGGEGGEVLRNRKVYFSINIQIVDSSDMQISDIVARWPGLVHDATILINSRIDSRCENREFGNAVLLGDSGYALQPFLLTPLAEPITRAQQLYNESLIRTRNIVDRTIGVWKSCFQCLAYGMRIKLETAFTVIVATAVLHNIARKMNEAEPPVLNADMLDYYADLGQMNNPEVLPALAEGQILQNYIKNNYFGNL